MKTKYTINFYFLLNSCGYSPIYLDAKNINFNLNIVEISGDDKMNKYLSTKIRKFNKQNSNIIYNLKIETSYQKDILSKNKKGEITNYLIKKEINFEIINPEVNKKFTYNQEIQTTNMDNQFDFKKYENSIKNNFINSKIDELILQLSNF